MDLGIKGRLALISGADSGMGKETARLLLEAGADLLVIARWRVVDVNAVHARQTRDWHMAAPPDSCSSVACGKGGP